MGKMTSKHVNQIEEIRECPACHSNHITKDSLRAELVCMDCGLVVDEELIDYGPEWRSFDQEQRDKQSRVGPPVTQLRHDKGLSTTLGWKNRDSYGKSIPNKKRGQIYRMRKWQKRFSVKDSMAKNLNEALIILNRITSALSLPRTVRERAAVLYREVVQKNLVRGRSIEGMVASSIYAACRGCGIPRTLDEISAKSHVTKKEIGRNYRFISRELRLTLMPPSPKNYVSRFCTQLHMGRETQVKAMDILNSAEEQELFAGRGPVGIAAAAIYMAGILCGDQKTQSEIANKMGITEVTVRNRYKELSEKLNIEILT